MLYLSHRVRLYGNFPEIWTQSQSRQMPSHPVHHPTRCHTTKPHPLQRSAQVDQNHQVPGCLTRLTPYFPTPHHSGQAEGSLPNLLRKKILPLPQPLPKSETNPLQSYQPLHSHIRLSRPVHHFPSTI